MHHVSLLFLSSRLSPALGHCCDAFKMISSMTNFGVEFVMIISNVSTYSLKLDKILIKHADLDSY